MAIITVSEKDYNESNLYYVQTQTAEIIKSTGSIYRIGRSGSRAVLNIECPDNFKEIVNAEIADKLAEIVAIRYKYEFFKKNITVGGMSKTEKEILMASLIAADLDEDKKYAFDRIKKETDVAIDGIYNFRLQPLKKKWQEIVSFVPSSFPNRQLKEFITYLLENKRRKIYIDGGKVYDSHYRRLKKCELLGGDEVSILREVLLSNCGEIELSGKIPEADEKYLREYYGDRIYFSTGYFS